MSLYRQAGGRRVWPIVVSAAIAAAVGFGIGAAVFSGSEEPNVADAVAELRAELAPARSALELVTIEYPQAFASGATAGETELGAARSHAETARSAVAAAAPELAILRPGGANVLEAELDDLVAAIDAESRPRLVVALARDAEGLIDRLLGA